MLEQLLIGVDVGTTQTKAGLFNPEGNMLAFARERYEILPGDDPTSAEQDPAFWLEAVLGTIKEVSLRAKGQIVGLCCGGQHPTMVMVDDQGVPLCNAILWMDNRCQDYLHSLKEQVEAPGPNVSILANALWVLRHRPDLYARTRWFLSAFDYIAYCLCGIAVTSVPWGCDVNVSDNLSQVGLNSTLFPPPVVAGTLIGHLSGDLAIRTGLPSGLPIVAGIDDGIESFLGAGLVKPGRAVDTAGTSGGFGLCWNTALPKAERRGTGLLEGQFIYGGAMAATGKALDWYRENVLLNTQSIEGLLNRAASVPEGAEGLLFLPYLAGERSPHYDPKARGAFVGLTLRHHCGHMARAILEGAAFALRDVAERIINVGARVDDMFVSGGPAASELWNQIKADVTGFSVRVPRVTEVSIVGAAILAGMGVGVISGPANGVAALVHSHHDLEPRDEYVKRYDHMFHLYRDLYGLLSPVFNSIAT